MKKDAGFILGCLVITVLPVYAICPSADLTGDCYVGLADVVALADQWLTGDGPTECPSSDLTEDCFVGLADIAVVAEQWMKVGIPDPVDMVWVFISDPGIEGHEGFHGYMSKYETTNAQFCEYLNAALTEGLIVVHSDGFLYDSSDMSYSQPYFHLHPSSYQSQIAYSNGVFTVRWRDGLSMANHPVTEASWYGAIAFCNYYGYRLPTEWEWNAVADYDGSYIWGCGTTIDSSKANLGKPNPLGLSSYPYTTPVGYYPAYGYGMCDMAGNMLEQTSILGREGTCSVLLGGAWDRVVDSGQIGSGGCGSLYITNGNWGFRVCR